MTKLINFDGILNRQAVKSYKLHPFGKEYQTAIFTARALRLITMFIGVYSGFYFVYPLALANLENSPKTAFIVALLLFVLFELFNNEMLSKLFKMLYRLPQKKYDTAGLLVIAVIVYSISFYAATNGLSQKQAEKTKKRISKECFNPIR